MQGQLTMAQVIFCSLTTLSTELALSLLLRTQSVVASIPCERWLDPCLDLPSLYLCLPPGPEHAVPFVLHSGPGGCWGARDPAWRGTQGDSLGWTPHLALNSPNPVALGAGRALEDPVILKQVSQDTEQGDLSRRLLPWGLLVVLSIFHRCCFQTSKKEKKNPVCAFLQKQPC